MRQQNRNNSQELETYRAVREIGDQVLVFATAGTGLGVLLDSVPAGGLGALLGATVGLVLGLLEQRQQDVTNACDSK